MIGLEGNTESIFEGEPKQDPNSLAMRAVRMWRPCGPDKLIEAAHGLMKWAMEWQEKNGRGGVWSVSLDQWQFMEDTYLMECRRETN